MKNNLKRLLCVTAALLLLALGFAALAETSDDALDSSQAQVETETADTQSEAEQYQAAYDAYCAARQENAVTDFESEVNAMVESGQLTQEQAGLLLNQAHENYALSNGVCPNCGAELGSGYGYGLGLGNGRGSGTGLGLGGGRGNSRGGRGNR